MTKQLFKALCFPTILVLILITQVCTPGKTGYANDFLLTGAIVSCGNLVIYQLSEDNKSYIQIIIDAKRIDLNRENTWDMAAGNSGITVRLREFPSEMASHLCNDIGTRKIKPTKQLNALSGSLDLAMSAADWKKYKQGANYKVDVQAEGLNFGEVKTYMLNINQASVGWLPG